MDHPLTIFLYANLRVALQPFRQHIFAMKPKPKTFAPEVITLKGCSVVFNTIMQLSKVNAVKTIAKAFNHMFGFILARRQIQRDWQFPVFFFESVG